MIQTRNEDEAATTRRRHAAVLAYACSCFLFLPQLLQAQSHLGSFSGRVLGEGNTPIAAAAVTVKTADDQSLVTALLTDGNGRFRFNRMPYGNYRLRIVFIGYKPHNLMNIVLSADTTRIDLGDLRLQLAPVSLPELLARTGQSPVLIQSDRTVYDAARIAAAATGKMIDVLRNIPELEVDPNGNVTTHGGQSVAIQFDGRQAPLKGLALSNYLQQSPGSAIAKVEVIPNPSAKYDPEGIGGIVNIVLRRDLDLGLSGSINTNLADHSRYGVFEDLNYQKKKLTVFSNLSVTHGWAHYTTLDLRQNRLTAPATFYTANGELTPRSTFMNADLTTELRIGDRGHWWTEATGSRNHTRRSSLSADEISGLADSVIQQFRRESVSNNKLRDTDLATGYKQEFGANRHELTADVRSSIHSNDLDADATKLAADVPSEVTSNIADGSSRETAFQVDYTRPLPAAARADIGIRASQLAESNDASLLYYTSVERTQILNDLAAPWAFTLNLRSAYAMFSRKIGHLAAQAGLRAELARSVFHYGSETAATRNYSSVFPSASLAYSPDSHKTLRVAYSKRIARPYPYLLNPDNPTADSLNRYSGNPDLRPSYTHSFTSDLAWNGSIVSMRVGPFYRRTAADWNAVRFVDSRGVSNLTYLNIVSVASFGATVALSLRATETSPVSGSASATLYRETRNTSNISTDYASDQLRWSASTNLEWRFDNTLRASFFARVDPPRQTMQGRVSGFVYMDGGFRKQLFNEKGTISLLVDDPFNQFHATFRTADASHSQVSETDYHRRHVYAAFSYNYGKSPKQNSRKQEKEIEQAETVQIR
jgi:ferric enterobactin receptor